MKLQAELIDSNETVEGRTVYFDINDMKFYMIDELNHRYAIKRQTLTMIPEFADWSKGG